MKYEKPNLQIIEWKIEDVICGSNGLGTIPDNENEWVTTSGQ